METKAETVGQVGSLRCICGHRQLGHLMIPGIEGSGGEGACCACECGSFYAPKLPGLNQGKEVK